MTKSASVEGDRPQASTSDEKRFRTGSLSILQLFVCKNDEAVPSPACLEHDGNNASIVFATNSEIHGQTTPWTPRSLGRAKSAIVYKQTLNDCLLVRETNIFFFVEWKPYFFSLQADYLLLYDTREKWEQGFDPKKVVELTERMMLSDMKVDVVDMGIEGCNRLFRRRILETDQLDQWLNGELRQSLVVSTGSQVDSVLSNNPEASAQVVLEFGSYNQNTFELWTKSFRRVLHQKRESMQHHSSESAATSDDDDPNIKKRKRSLRSWVSPGHDSRVTLHQSEVWCNRVLRGEKEKAESEMRRIIAMEKLVSQVTNARMALLVYEKVSRVYELFVANSRREVERIDGRDKPLSGEVLNFFSDHLKRKYSVFLILALAFGVAEEQIRDAHESMCRENSAILAGVGGGSGEQHRSAILCGFDDPESVDLYEKYRDAALNYYRMNYGDESAAEEEDAIMHLPVMLQVSIIRRDLEESKVMQSILEIVKCRLIARSAPEQQDNEQE